MPGRSDLAFLSGLAPTLHIAHRGGALLWPENTMLAFREAVALGTDQIETDVHLSADGQVMIFHDPTLERCTDAAGPIEARTAAELAKVDAAWHFEVEGTHPYRGQGHGVPRLVDVLRAFPDLPLNIDLKAGSPDLIQAFVALLEAEGAVDRICMGSEDDATGEALFDALPDACHFFPRAALTNWVMAAFTGSALPEDDRWSVIDMPIHYQGTRIVTEKVVAAAARDRRWINVWTIDETDEMVDLVKLGVGGIMTDRPDRLRAVLDR